MSKKLIPDDFEVPKALETNKFRLRELTVNDLEKDYDVVFSSADYIRGVFGEKSPWPDKNITKEQDLEDLRWHQGEFEKRSSFAYTVFSLDESQCLGCVYIFPSRKESFDADVFCWVRKSEFDKGLDSVLFKTVKDWISKVWPMKKVAYPGRDIPWSEWKKIK